MSLRLLFSIQLILQLTLLVHTKASSLTKRKEVYKQDYGSKEIKEKTEDIFEITKNNEKISHNEDYSGDSSAKNDKKNPKTKEWNIVVKDFNMINEPVDKATIEALEEGEIEGVRWNPLAKDISYKILLNRGNHNRKENVSMTPLFTDEETTQFPITKSTFKSEEVETVHKKLYKDKETLPYFKQKSKIFSLGNNKRIKNIKTNFKTLEKESRNETKKSRKETKLKSFLDAYLEQQRDYSKNFDSSLKSEETKLLEKQIFLLNHSEEETTKNPYLENGEIEGLNWEERGNEKKYPVNKTIENILLGSVDDRYETLLQEMQVKDTKPEEKVSKPNKNKYKGMEKKVTSQTEEKKEMQEVKSYIQKELEELKTRFDTTSQENAKPTEGTDEHSVEKKLDIKLQNKTEYWVPIKSHGKPQKRKHGLEMKNFTKVEYFVPKTRRKILKIRKVKRKKNKRKHTLSNMEQGETYFININLPGVKDTHMPFVKQFKDDTNKTEVFNKTIEINITNDNRIDPETENRKNSTMDTRRKKSLVRDDTFITAFKPRSIKNSISHKNIEMDIANSYTKNSSNKIVAKRQSVELIKKLEDRNVGMIYHFQDFVSEENKDRQDKSYLIANYQKKISKKKKKPKNIHEWFAHTKNKTIDYFTNMGKKIKKFFKKNHAHQFHVAAPVRADFS